MIAAIMALALLQAPAPQPVVQMHTPTYAAVQMFADGTTVLPLLPALPVRAPQDSNDVAVKFNAFGREICALGNTVSIVKAVVDKHKISCP